MELSRSQKNWDQLGKDDPLWVVLTHSDKKGGRWEPSEFFATGRAEIAAILQEVASLGQSVKFGRALDFGCGVGRLTQALATHFDEVHGIDISPSMIEHARNYNSSGAKCVFQLNSRSDLGLFPNDYFDFVYSNFVLQHIEPKYSIRYIEEFVRVLKPGGICAFQLWTATFLRRLFPEFLAESYRRLKFQDKPAISMFGIPENRITEVVQNVGGTIVRVKREKSSDFSVRWRWASLHFIVVKSLAP